LAESKSERIPKKLSINVDPSTAPETVGGKNLTIVSPNNMPSNAVAKRIASNHKDLRQ